MEWFLDNAQAISALASAGMLVIWSMYAWLFYQEFRRQRGSQLFIHEGGSQGPNATCMLVNLSKEPIHVLCSMAAYGDETVQLHDTEKTDGAGPINRTKQGPLQMGELLELGSFKRICQALNLPQSSGSDEISEFEIRVVGIHGFREWPVGARRRFQIDHKTSEIWPLTERTEQLRSKRHAAEVRNWIASCRARGLSDEGG
ncbi:hypothetical protein F6455_03235 [Proteobacteria bacterium 005FR1]|nr:hypothetical protein [Proteobacteria bacterium 005FR1]